MKLMTFHKTSGLILASLMLWGSSPAKAENDPENSAKNNAAQASRDNLAGYQSFITEVGNQIVAILANRSSSLDQRREQFRDVLRKNFDIKSIGKFVLARHWRKLTEDQKSRFIGLFEEALVENYSSQFDNYQNESLQVIGVRNSNDGGVKVQSEVIRPHGGKSLKVEWKVFNKNAQYSILDISIDGVSLSNTQRSTYDSTIQNNNGDVDALLSSMGDKKASSKDTFGTGQ
ncbi:MAG: ABC transporter substrate-binding protein [Alphaproteobacteria bacterium]|nr:ABC transporter substrate-binding protein [Alphaproteobacteria bacterium]